MDTDMDAVGGDPQDPARRALRQELERRLLEIPHLSLETWKDTALLCVLFKGKEVAHFHGQTILDLRLTPKIIREAGLPRAVSARIHPNRSPNSRWICIEVCNQSDIEALLHLVRRACAVMG